MFLLILLVAVALCAAILYLPYAAGLTKVEKVERKREVAKKTPVQEAAYVPPDEEWKHQQADAQSRASLRDKVRVTSRDMPIRITLNQDAVLRKRGERAVVDADPNSYDYDLDDLIREETAGEAARREKEFYAREAVGGDKEAMV